MKKALRTILISTAIAAVPASMIVVAGAGQALAAGTYPNQYSAPYLQIDSGDAGDMSADMKSSGDAYYTLAFLIPKSGCTPEWEDSSDAMNAFTSQVKSLQAAGGNVIISSGGESGGELAQTCTSVSSLEAEYASIVSTYGITRLDFDIEGPTLDDTASNARRDQALAALQAANPAVTVDFTLPVDPTGMESDALALLKDAKSKGVKVNLVNIMTMDFGNGQNALKDAESAAPASESQINGIFGGIAAQSWHMLGLTPIAGKNDDNENFTEANAVTLESFAASNGVQELSFWELDSYDKATGYTYSKDFNKITSGTAPSNNFSVAVSPASGSVAGSAGGSVSATVSTAVAAGSAEPVTLSASGGPAGSSVTVSPSSVTSGGTATLNVTVAAGTAAGTYPITVTGTDGVNTHTATYTLTVSATITNNFSLAVSPTSGSVAGSAGGTLSAAVNTTVASGAAEPVTLSASGGPAGSSVTVSPSSVTSGGSATLNVTAAAGTAAGTYPITVSGTDGVNTHTAAYTLTVTGASTVYQAEATTNTLAGGAAVYTCAACSGGARVGNIGGAGTLTMNGITVATTGAYTVTVAYTNGDTSAITSLISVNGGATTSFSGAPTADWNTPANGVTTLNLIAGANTIEFSDSSATDTPDIDAITIGAMAAPSGVYQAEAPANTLAGGAVVISCGTCSGSARVGYLGSGGTLTINGITVATAGTYEVTIAYTQAESSSLTADVSVNGAAAKAVAFAETPSFTSPENKTVALKLAAGTNTIEFSNSSADAPDIDAITVPGSPS